MLKRLFSIFTISLILTGVFLNSFNIDTYVYADTVTDEWQDVTTNDQLVQAFKYYCKSRDITIEGSVADAVTSFTTKTFNGIVNTLGIDVNVLQANLKYQTGNNIGTRFLFNALSIDAYNRIFSQFLQDNDLEVGDVVDDKVLYSGFLFYDTRNYPCLGWVTTSQSTSSNDISSFVISKGDYYLYSNSAAQSYYDGGISTVPIYLYNNNSFNNDSFTINVFRRSYRDYQADITYYCYGMGSNSDANIFYGRGVEDGGVIVTKVNNNFYLCTFRIDIGFSAYHYVIKSIQQVYFKNSEDIEETIVIATTNNTVINNNTYEGDTIINNEGDVINNNYPDPNPNPTPDPPTIPDSGGWQDFTLPEMPNDWLIYGMEKKFPFDIPFNILFGLSLLNHEPEIPQFEGDIDLKVCTWHYDIDLTPFDDIAKILRKFEVLAFIIGLAMITKELIMWG